MRVNDFIQSLQIRNLLSYGEASAPVPLKPLNVLIGPNASGKSNLLQVIRLLQALPKDFPAAIRTGGGIAEWLWKGGAGTPVAEIEADVSYWQNPFPLQFRISITMTGQRMEIVDEVIKYGSLYNFQRGNLTSKKRVKDQNATEAESKKVQRIRHRLDVKPEQSILSQLKDPLSYPEITFLGDQFAEMKLYREWNLGRSAPLRVPQKTDAPGDFLLEDFSNLGLVLNDLFQLSENRHKVIEYLNKFYPEAIDISIRIYGGSLQVFIEEKTYMDGSSMLIPATRLSDGTLRYLCLLAILCHPTPPPLICIEEPELGLHPDILPIIAELLQDASQRTQIIVTTHSDVLVSALSETPEAILVCERDRTGTRLRRLEPDKLQAWLKDYSLGELWRMGELGGTRW